MNRNLPAFVLMAACALAATAQPTGQSVYRCGDSYSQKPCAGGTLVQTDDARSDRQRQAARETAQQTSKSADAMEKARLKDEAKAAPAYLGPPQIEPDAPGNTAGAAVKPKKPQYFTAAGPKKPGETAAKKKKGKKKAAASAKKSDT